MWKLSLVGYISSSELKVPSQLRTTAIVGNEYEKTKKKKKEQKNYLLFFFSWGGIDRSAFCCQYEELCQFSVDMYIFFLLITVYI